MSRDDALAILLALSMALLALGPSIIIAIVK
jgi:hypothetical protein